jgi:GNAT superfamily N-acetyltransferase
VIRSPRATDQSFVAATWTRTMQRVRGEGRAIGKLVDRVLERADTRCLVLSPAHDPDRIHAWIVYAEGPKVPLVHYVFTRPEHRRKGYARELLARAGVRIDAASVFTQQSRDTVKLTTAFPMAAHLPLPEFLKPSKEIT